MSLYWAFLVAIILMLWVVSVGIDQIGNLPRVERNAGQARFWIVLVVSGVLGALLAVAVRKKLVPTGSYRLWIALVLPIAGAVGIFQTLASARTKLLFYAVMAGMGLTTVLWSFFVWQLQRRRSRADN